jgi:predicted lipid-binding transport protein (Tim44 family)
MRTVIAKEAEHMSEEGSCGRFLGLVAAVVIGLVLGGLALSAVFWAFGLIFHLFFWLARVAVIVGLVALVLWMFDHRRSRRMVS